MLVLQRSSFLSVQGCSVSSHCKPQGQWAWTWWQRKPCLLPWSLSSFLHTFSQLWRVEIFMIQGALVDGSGPPVSRVWSFMKQANTIFSCSEHYLGSHTLEWIVRRCITYFVNCIEASQESFQAMQRFWKPKALKVVQWAFFRYIFSTGMTVGLVLQKVNIRTHVSFEQNDIF